MHSHGPRRVVARLPASSSTNTSSRPFSTKKVSSTSWVWAAFPCPGSTYMIDRVWARAGMRSEEHTSELQSLMRISYAVFCLKKKKKQHINTIQDTNK